MSKERVHQHYHVDVFAGEDRRYVRGFVLREIESGWQILDDFGLAGERGRILADGLQLNEGVVKALSLLHGLLGPPLYPVWRTAPYELAGYEKPKVRLWPPWRRGKSAIPEMRVGADGKPESSS